MPTNKKAKAEVRARMARTGESYTAAKKQLESGAHPIPVIASGARSTGPVLLTERETVLATSIRTQLGAIWSLVEADTLERVPAMIEAMGVTAHELHMSLQARGHEPRHNKWMLRNREVAPTDPRFYVHIHPTEDLLDFINDQSANDDPMDITLEHDFTFPVYSRRWGHEDVIHLRRTKRGWTATYIQTFEADRDGRADGQQRSGLFAHLHQELVNYPQGLPGYLEYLWNEAQERGLSHDEVQNELTRLANWVSDCERSTPDGVFTSY